MTSIVRMQLTCSRLNVSGGREREGKNLHHFGLSQSCFKRRRRGGYSGTSSFLPSFSSPVRGDDDKSSRDVVTHNQIHSPSSPPPASTPEWLLPAPTPTTPNISEGHDSPENTAHVFDVPHIVHPSLNPCVSREPTPNTQPLPLPALSSAAG